MPAFHHVRADNVTWGRYSTQNIEGFRIVLKVRGGIQAHTVPLAIYGNKSGSFEEDIRKSECVLNVEIP